MNMETAATNVAETGAAAPESAQVTESAPVATTTAQPEVKNQPPNDPEWYVKRIGEYTAQARQFERRALTAEQERERLQRELEQARTATPEKVKVLADFDYDETKYHSYLFEQTEKRAVEAARRFREQEAAAASRQSRQQKFREREAEFEKEAADYRLVAYAPDLPISEGMAEAIQEADMGPSLLHYLGRNREISSNLSSLPTSVASFQLGLIAAQLKSERDAKAAALAAAKAEKAVSQAPPPTPSIEGSNAKVEKDPHKMTDAEYAKWRKNQIAQRR